MSTKSSKIVETTDYSIFKKIVGNRAVRPIKLGKLIAGIRRKNLLAHYQILLNEKMEVIDGQYRLAAAKTLKVSIFYKVVPGLTLEDVQLLNTNSNPWNLTDHLDSFIKKGNEDYKILKAFMERYGFGMTTSLMMLSTKDFSDTHKLTDDFRDGLFKVVNYQSAIETADFLQKMKPYLSPYVYNNRSFLRTIIKLHVSKKIKADRMIEKLIESRRMVPALATVRDYYRFFEDIYYYHAHSGKRERFF